MGKRYLFWSMIVILTIYLSLDTVALFALESIGSHILGAKVSASEVKADILDNKLHVKNLKICNSGKFNEPYLVEANDIDIDINLSSLLSQTIIIEDIRIANADITYELAPQLSIEGNIVLIRKNIENYTAKNADTGQKIIIHSLLTDNCKFKYNLAESDTHTTYISDLKIENIGVSEGGVYLKQAAWEILIAMLLKG